MRPRRPIDTRGTTGSLPGYPEEAAVGLLRAALRRDGTAVAAWQTWHDRHGLGDGVAGAWRLLPLVYHNLRPRAADVPGFESLESRWLAAQYESSVIRAVAATVIRHLARQGVGLLALKGLAAARYYPDPGWRPMGDFDLLVHPGDAARTIAALESIGWKTVESRWSTQDSHATTLRSAARAPCDLHWHALQANLGPDSDDDFRAAAVPGVVAGVPVAMLGDADFLVHTCGHAAYGGTGCLQWVVDLATMLTHPQVDLDWERVLAVTRRRHLGPLVLGRLEYLRSQFDLDIPGAVLADLRRQTLAPWVRLALQSREGPNPPLRRGTLWHKLKQIPGQLAYYLVSRDLRPTPAALRGFVRVRFGVNTMGGLLKFPARAIRKWTAPATPSGSGSLGRSRGERVSSRSLL